MEWHSNFSNIKTISLVFLVRGKLKRKVLTSQSKTLSITNVIFSLYIALPGMTALFSKFHDNIYTHHVINIH